ncbi:hypothetical protein ERX35_000015 [Macrococcus equipercicus]|uniref:TFIIS-type domain-containing protein n=1 Tax=Macrococcus equipercicus TaxID=69967 RepID=A0ABQ6RAM7_9STAP|nr:hypothetical protein [Macrococcus equipercicus]KAA1042303.1 hypothetical protein ERX35_000015 [Macrococcus equipercicus]
MGTLSDLISAIEEVYKEIKSDRVKKEYEENKFITTIDPETNITKYQCPKCKSYNAGPNLWQSTPEYYKIECKDCGYSFVSNWKFENGYY